jgi:hypothetical protein
MIQTITLRRQILLSVMLVALSVSAASVSPVRAEGAAQQDVGEPEPVVEVGHDLTVASGETVQGDAVALGGNVMVEAGGVVEGNVLALDGDIWVDGTVRGNAVAFGGVVSTGESGTVGGQVFMLGRRGVRMLPLHVQSVREAVVTRGWGMISSTITALAAGLMAALVAALGPAPLAHVRQAIVDAPVMAGVIGLLSLVVGSLASGLMVATCIFIPLAVIILALYAVGALLGWSALGMLLGDSLLRAARVDMEHLSWVAALLGTILLTFAIRVFGVFPGGNAISTALGTLTLAVGLGAVALTRFGSRAHE